MGNVAYRYLTRESFTALGAAASPDTLYYVQEADGSLSHYKGQQPTVPPPHERGRGWSDLKKVAFTGQHEDLQGAPQALPPSGEAGGDLKGSYPHPSVSEDKLKGKAIAFEEAEGRDSLTSGDTLAQLFGKIKRWLSSLAKVAFTGSYRDLADAPALPTTEALRAEVQALVADRKPAAAAPPARLLLRARRVGASTQLEVKVCVAGEAVEDFLSKKPCLALLRKKLRRAKGRGKRQRVERKYVLSPGGVGAHPPRPDTDFRRIPITRQHVNRWGGTGYTASRLANLFMYGRTRQGAVVALRHRLPIAASRVHLVVMSGNGNRNVHRLPPTPASNRHLCWEGGLLLCYREAGTGGDGLVRLDERRYAVGYVVANGLLHEQVTIQ